MMKLVDVPVNVCNSIANPSKKWLFSYLSCLVSTLEGHLKALRRANFQTISLQALHEDLSSGREIPYRSVVLTFDVGYLDSRVYAYPQHKLFRILFILARLIEVVVLGLFAKPKLLRRSKT